MHIDIHHRHTMTIILLLCPSGVLKGSGIEVVGPVFPDESAEEAPPLHCVTKMLRERHSCSEGATSSVLQAGGCATATKHKYVVIMPFDEILPRVL